MTQHTPPPGPSSEPSAIKAAILGDTERVPIDAIVPYWRNPRQITEEALDALQLSIEEFGYSQPILVDSSMVIIAGHTRYAALRRLGATEVDVTVARDLSPAQAKQYRIIDNRVGEYSTWDYNKLADEVAGLDASTTVLDFFPEFGEGAILDADRDSAGADGGDGDAPAPGSVADAWSKVDMVVPFTCPYCAHAWRQEITREQVLTGVITGVEGETSQEQEEERA